MPSGERLNRAAHDRRGGGLNPSALEQERRTVFGVRSPSADEGPSSPRESGETSVSPRNWDLIGVPLLQGGFRCRATRATGATPPPLTHDRLSQRQCHRQCHERVGIRPDRTRRINNLERPTGRSVIGLDSKTGLISRILA